MEIERIDGINPSHEAHGYRGRTDLDGFHIFPLEATYPETRDVAEPHRLGFYTVAFFTRSDDARLTVDTETMLGLSDTVAFSTPSSVVSWTRGADQAGYIVHFTARFVGAFLDDPAEVFPYFRPETGAIYDVAGDQQIPSLFDGLHERFHDPIPSRPYVLQHQLLALLWYLDGALASDGGPDRQLGPDHLLAHAFRRLVNERFAQTRIVADYARELGVSSDRLSRATRAALGRSPRQILADRTIQEAMTALLNGDLTIGALAGQLGFADTATFSRFFTREVGESPTHWRSGQHES